MAILGVRKRAALPSQARVLPANSRPWCTPVGIDLVVPRPCPRRTASHRRVRAAMRAHRHHVVVARRSAAATRTLGCRAWSPPRRGTYRARSSSTRPPFSWRRRRVFGYWSAPHTGAHATLLVDVIGFVAEQSEVIAARVALARVWVPPARVRVALVAARRAALVPLAPGITAGAAAVHVVVALVLIW